MKNKDWGRGREGLIERGGGGFVNFPPLKRGSLLERGGGLIEDLRYDFICCIINNAIEMPETKTVYSVVHDISIIGNVT